MRGARYRYAYGRQTRGLAMTTTTQIRARYGRMYALAIAILAALSVAGAVGAGNGGQATMDVSAIMNSIDVGSLPVHNITDAF